MISTEQCNVLKLEYLEQLSASDLAHWLINSFTPARFWAGDKDVIFRACQILREKVKDDELCVYFIKLLWGMHE